MNLRDSVGVFSIFSLVKILIISLISSLSLNLLVYDRNIFRSSLKVCGNLWTFLENDRERSSGLQDNFGKSLKIFRKVVRNLWKVIKNTATVPFFLKSNCLPLPDLFFRNCSYLLYHIKRQTALAVKYTQSVC